MRFKVATIVGDVTGLQQRHHPLKVNLILLSRSTAFRWRQNRFEILQIIMIKNSGEGFHPPLPLKPRWGMNLRVRPRVNPVKLIWIICFTHLLYSRGEKTEKELLRLWWWWWWLSSILQLLQCNFPLPNYNLPVKVSYTRKGAIICTTMQSVSRE